jgi:hypothetical protein
MRRARIARPTVGAVGRWLTGQSGVPPDSPVNFSRTPLNVSRERRFRRGQLPGLSDAPPDSPVHPDRAANSIPITFLMFLALRHNTLVLKSMY